MAQANFLNKQIDLINLIKQFSNPKKYLYNTTFLQYDAVRSDTFYTVQYVWNFKIQYPCDVRTENNVIFPQNLTDMWENALFCFVLCGKERNSKFENRIFWKAHQGRVLRVANFLIEKNETFTPSHFAI